MINILVEGPDCSGKSTLQNLLKNKLKWDSISLHHKKGNQFNRYLRAYANYSKTIIDRGHISEMVYSELWRDGNSINKKERDLLKNLIELNTLVIFCCPDLKVLETRYKKRNYYQQIKLKEIKIIQKKFMKFMKNIPHIKYKSSSFVELENLVEVVKKNESIFDSG